MACTTWSTLPTPCGKRAADALDWDTTGASGDPEFLAALRGDLRSVRAKYPDMGVELGALAGRVPCSACPASSSTTASAWPACGPFNSCGPCRRPAPPCRPGLTSTPARAALEHGPGIDVREAVHGRARIPIHMNAGMGVGGVPMFVYPVVECRVPSGQSCVDILRLDACSRLRRPLGMQGSMAARAWGGMRAAGDLWRACRCAACVCSSQGLRGRLLG